ncbi:hypothetical protein EDB89DRAFT_1917250 [Lactarius sanguifluus]|nr:hypothetical protein EDB89DRAFT_1917250 [Lactarius sanguifluus]
MVMCCVKNSDGEKVYERRKEVELMAQEDCAKKTPLVAFKYTFGQRSDLSHVPLIYPSSSWEGTVNSTAPSYIDLVTPKINQAYPSKLKNDPGAARQLSEDMGSRPRRLARLVAAGVPQIFNLSHSLAYTNSSEKINRPLTTDQDYPSKWRHRSDSELNKDPGARLPEPKVNIYFARQPGHRPVPPSLPVGPASRRRDDGVCAQTLIARVASDFCHHTRRLIRYVGADICQGRQDAGVAVAALRLLAGRGGRARAQGRGKAVRFALNKINPVRENAHAWPKRVCTTTPTPLSLRGLVPAHEYPFVLRQRTRPPSYRVQAERERRRSRYISWNAFPLLLFELVPKGGGQVDQVG